MAYIPYGNTYVGGVGFVGALQLIFITLKLLDKIDWSWWWVLSPIWISLTFGLGIICLIILLAVLFGWFK